MQSKQTTNTMNISFAVGAMSRDALEDVASDFGIEYTKHTTSDCLRAEVLEAFDEQGEPCTKVEYADAFWGGDFSGVGSHVYVPNALIEAFGGDVELAFGKHTHKDPVHIISYSSDEVFTADGHPFVELAIVEGQ